MLPVLLAIAGVGVGYGGSTVVVKRRRGSAEAKADKELKKAKTEDTKLVHQAREEANKAKQKTPPEDRARRRAGVFHPRRPGTTPVRSR